MFDQEKADKAIQFFKRLKHTKGQWAGKPFNLLSWQEKILRDVFGTVTADGYRQYRTAYIEIPKKQGKSEVAAGVAVKLLAADNEQAAEIYSCAADRQQASIVFDIAVSMVEQWPELKSQCKLVLSQKRIVYYPTRSFYQVLSSEHFTKHGLNPHGVIFDELHAQPNRSLYDVMTAGASDARLQPLTFIITTAGDDPDRTSICWEVHKKAQEMLDGIYQDPTWYSVIYGAKESDDWTDPKVWAKANPSLGEIMGEDRIAAMCRSAKKIPAEERLFRQLRLNQWVKTKASKWLSLDLWDKCAGEIPNLKGRSCYAGMDLSSTLDITAYVRVFPPTESDPKYYVLPTFWIPEEAVDIRSRRDGVPYDTWVKQGLIETTPGNVIDYDFVRKKILDLADQTPTLEVAFDPWNATQMAIQLENEGLQMVQVRQGMQSLSPPMKELEKLVRGGQINHGGNNILRWMLGNTEIKMDENMNIKPIKTKKGEKIDGILALIMGLDRAMRQEPPKTSVYEERGLAMT